MTCGKCKCTEVGATVNPERDGYIGIAICKECGRTISIEGDNSMIVYAMLEAAVTAPVAGE